MDSTLLMEQMLRVALLKRASDIHLQPREKEGQIYFRVDGYLILWLSCSTEQLISLVAKVKYLSEMDIAEKRIPQDGSLHIKQKDLVLQLRISTIPTIYGEKLVIRMFVEEQAHLTLPQLGFSASQFVMLQNMIYQPHGLLLITGPTGSGKTTTLYKTLRITINV